MTLNIIYQFYDIWDQGGGENKKSNKMLLIKVAK